MGRPPPPQGRADRRNQGPGYAQGEDMNYVVEPGDPSAGPAAIVTEAIARSPGREARHGDVGIFRARLDRGSS